jgi:hypothetical protein
MKPRPGSSGPPTCIFHAQDEESVAKRTVVRRMGPRLDPVLEPLGELPVIRLDTVEGLREFQMSTLQLLLRRKIEPQAARAACEIAGLVHGHQVKQDQESSFDAFANKMAEVLGREFSANREQVREEDSTS